MMSLLHHVFKSLKYYWRSHLTVVIGIAVSSMVLTGTLIVGDSITSSLEKSTLLRLGKTEYVFSGIDRYFRASLASDLNESIDANIAPLLQLNGIASAQGGKYKLNGIQVIGIDANFSSFMSGLDKTILPAENEAYISDNLAQRLQLKVGDSFVLKVEKASQIPKNAPFISATGGYISLRLKAGKILDINELSRFNLKTSQTAPYNVFVSLSYLTDKMDLADKANHILFSKYENANEKTILKELKKHWTTGDMALELHSVNNGEDWEIRSDRVFMDATIVKAAKQIDNDAKEILTYMVNSFKIDNRETPYSFLSAGPFLDQDTASGTDIVINDWIAEDLQASIGDSIEVSYYTIGPLRKLSEESKWFSISDIVAIEGIYAEKDLMPNLPGLSDAGNCRDWEAGVPVKLDKIRDKDEDYWKQHRGTPKAFISYEIGKELWKNRFGVCTAIRLSSEDQSSELIEKQLAELISPSSLGFSLKSVKKDGLAAARGGVDFSQLFMGLSFFLLVAGLVLMALLFNLHMERRKVEIGTLKAIGYSFGLIRKMVLLEGLFLAVPGVIAGGLLAILYNKVIFKALNTIWYTIVRTSVLQEDVRLNTLLLGIGSAFILVFATMWFNIFKKLKVNVTDLQKKLHIVPNRNNNFLLYASWGTGLIAVGLLIYESSFGETLNSGLFFLLGVLLLAAFLFFIAFRLRNRNIKVTEQFSLQALVQGNLCRNSARSLRIIILFSLVTFVIIATGLNKKDMHTGAEKRSSGTGGFLFYMETTLPVLQDLNAPETLTNLGIDQSLKFVQLRKNEGDDASCLNLNRVTTPRILGVPATKLKGRFSFIKATSDLDTNDPWRSLKTKLEGNVIPAIADQTVIQWGLGKKIGDTLVYLDEFGNEMKLKLIGGLANSVFQGNILIDEDLFLEHFPSSSGTHVFLVDGFFDKSKAATETLSRAFRNEGLELEFTADRLATFNQVENTYLSIFLLLGGLAMILGTLGLGVVLIRNIMDREQEIGILQAIGYRKKDVLKLITIEHIALLLIGTLSGAMTAFMAIFPSLLSEFVRASWQTALIIIALILANGFFWIILITRKILRNDLHYSLRTE